MSKFILLSAGVVGAVVPTIKIGHCVPKNSDFFTCSSAELAVKAILEGKVQRLAGASYNETSGALQSLNIELHQLDSAGTQFGASMAMANFATDQQVNAVVGCDGDVTTRAAAVSSKATKMVLVGHNARASDLSDSEAYPYFLRTVPSIALEADVISQMVHHDFITKVNILSVEDPSNSDLITHIDSKLKSTGVETNTFELGKDGESEHAVGAWGMDQRVAQWDAVIDSLKTSNVTSNIVMCFPDSMAVAVMEYLFQKHPQMFTSNYKIFFCQMKSFESGEISALAKQYHVSLEGSWAVMSETASAEWNKLKEVAVESTISDYSPFCSNFGDQSNFDDFGYFDEERIESKKSAIAAMFDGIFSVVQATHQLMQEGALVSNVKGDMLLNRVKQMSFNGATGLVRFDAHGDSNGYYYAAASVNDEQQLDRVGAMGENSTGLTFIKEPHGKALISQGVCEDGWKYASGFCFQMDDASMSWDDAWESCSSRLPGYGVTLATLDSEEQHDAIRDQMTHFEGLWLGLSSRGRDDFVWVANQNKPSFTAWMPDEPMDGNHCAAVGVNWGQWQSDLCSTTRPFACSYVPRDMENTNPGCKPGFTRSDAHCIASLYKPMSFYKAEEACIDLGVKSDVKLPVHLATIPNEVVHKSIETMTKPDQTIGGVWVGLRERGVTQEDFRWVSGDIVEYTSWGGNQPSASLRSVDTPAACQGLAQTMNVTDQHTVEDCAAAVAENPSCSDFLFYSESGDCRCVRQMANCSSTSVVEGDFDGYELKRCVKMDSTPSKMYTAPCSEEKLSVCSYPASCDSSIIQPYLDAMNMTSTCTHLSSGSSCPIDTIRCNDPFSEVVGTFQCTLGQLTMMPTCRSLQNSDSRLFENDGCPSGWMVVNNTCLTASDSLLSWGKAEEACNMMGGAHLITVNTAEFHSIARSLANRHSDEEGVWIGYYERASTEPYTWVSEEENGFERWRAGEPNNDHVERTDLQVCSHAPGFIDLTRGSTSINMKECTRRAAESSQCSNIFFFSHEQKTCGCLASTPSVPSPLTPVPSQYKNGAVCTCQDDAGCGGAKFGEVLPLLAYNVYELKQCAVLGLLGDGGVNGTEEYWYDGICSQTRKSICSKKKMCPVHDPVPLLTSTCGVLESDSSCPDNTLSCPKGFEVSGKFSCKHGQYLSHAECVPASCPAPDAVQETLNSTCGKLPSGGSCGEENLICHDSDNYEIEGEFKCDHGNSTEVAICKPKSCKLGNYSNMNITNCQVIESGESCEDLSCVSDDYKLVGRFECDHGRLTQYARCHPKVSSGCPGGWTGADGACFTLDKSLLTFAEGQERCEQYGGNLAMIGSQEQQDAVRTSANRSSFSEGAWIGLSADLKSDEYTWVDGRPIDFDNWRAGQPAMTYQKTSVYQVCEGEQRLIDLSKPLIDQRIKLTEKECALRAFENGDCSPTFFYRADEDFCKCIPKAHKVDTDDKLNAGIDCRVVEVPVSEPIVASNATENATESNANVTQVTPEENAATAVNETVVTDEEIVVNSTETFNVTQQSIDTADEQEEETNVTNSSLRLLSSNNTNSSNTNTTEESTPVDNSTAVENATSTNTTNTTEPTEEPAAPEEVDLPKVPAMVGVSAYTLDQCAIIGSNKDLGAVGAEEYWYSSNCNVKRQAICSLQSGCGKIQTTPGMSHKCDDLKSGDICHDFACATGYTQQSHFECYNGKLTSSARCIAQSCGVPPQIKNLIQTEPCGELKTGDSCDAIKCATGYTLQGSYSCDNGELKLPSCGPSSCSTPPPVEGVITTCAALNHGQTCSNTTVSCNNTNQNLAQTYKCEYGQYTELPICVDDTTTVKVTTGFRTYFQANINKDINNTDDLTGAIALAYSEELDVPITSISMSQECVADCDTDNVLQEYTIFIADESSDRLSTITTDQIVETINKHLTENDYNGTLINATTAEASEVVPGTKARVEEEEVVQFEWTPTTTLGIVVGITVLALAFLAMVYRKCLHARKRARAEGLPASSDFHTVGVKATGDGD